MFDGITVGVEQGCIEVAKGLVTLAGGPYVKKVTVQKNVVKHL